MTTKAFIFDLDGVIVDTAKYHYLAWKKIANSLDIDFTH
ncbi:MAG: beta-phosphoglucomutase, partial [Flavobacterium sp.]